MKAERVYRAYNRTYESFERTQPGSFDQVVAQARLWRLSVRLHAFGGPGAWQMADSAGRWLEYRTKALELLGLLK